MQTDKQNRPKKFYIFAGSLFAAVLVVAGFIAYQINTSLNTEIYGTPSGKVEGKAPSDLDLNYEDITFASSNPTANELTLTGWFVDGDAADCVILAPGKGKSRWALLDYAPFLHKAGYDVLLFDPQGTGKSEGKKWAFGYFESRDIRNAMQFLKENYAVQDFGVLGKSAGAAAALMAALDSEAIDAVVADSPFASVKLASESYGDYEENPLFDMLFPLYAFRAKQMLEFNVLEKTNIIAMISNLKTPTFFIHGGADRVLYPKNTEILHRNKTGEKRIWVPGGVGHARGFDEQPQMYKNKVVNFFKSHL